MQIKTITFNIWDIPLPFCKDRHKRVHAMGGYLKNLDADIICLQEVFDVKHRDSIHETLGKKIYHRTPGNGDTRRTVILRRFDRTGGLEVFSKFPILKSKFIPFKVFAGTGPTEYVGKKGWTETIIQTPQGKMLIINAHFHAGTDSRRGKMIRRKQLQQLLLSIEHVTDPIIFAGDFNEELSEKKLFKKLEEHGFQNSEKNENEVEPTYRVGNYYTNIPFVTSTKKDIRIDYILTKNTSPAMRVLASHVPPQPNPPLSDHDPVLAIFEM